MGNFRPIAPPPPPWRRGRRRAIAVVLSAIAAFSAPAFAQPACMDRAALVDHLAERYRETPAAGGVVQSGSGVIELFAAKDGDSWTLVYTRADGASCLIAAGNDWQRLPEISPAAKAPAT